MKLLGLIASALALDYDDLDKGKNKGSKRPAKVDTFTCGGGEYFKISLQELSLLRILRKLINNEPLKASRKSQNDHLGDVLITDSFEQSGRHP